MPVLIRGAGGGGGLNIDDILPYINGAHIEFDATAGDNTLHLRTQTAGYDCTIHWGDGSETVAPADGGNIIHNYTKRKTYHIFITGKSFAGFYVNNQTGSGKYVAVHSMGKWEVDTATDFSSCFSNCYSLTTIPSGLFQYNTAVTSFVNCFQYCKGLTSLPSGLFQYNTAVTSFGNCFGGCKGLTSLPSGLFQHNTAVTNFSSCFSSCSSLTAIPADLFQHNTAVTNFSSCFSSCSSLTTIPSGLFQYNTAATNFSRCFSDCTSLTAIPAGLFQYNTAATSFSGCLQSCFKLTLRADIFGTDYGARFSGKTVNFSNCFNRTVFTGTQGAAPALWEFAFGGVTAGGCFGGNGNSAASLTNYGDIPSEWK